MSFVRVISAQVEGKISPVILFQGAIWVFWAVTGILTYHQSSEPHHLKRTMNGKVVVSKNCENAHPFGKIQVDIWRSYFSNGFTTTNKWTCPAKKPPNVETQEFGFSTEGSRNLLFAMDASLCKQQHKSLRFFPHGFCKAASKFQGSPAGFRSSSSFLMIPSGGWNHC